MVANFMEEYVLEQLLRFLNSHSEYADICKCQECIDNMLAHILNNIPPVYYTSLEGQVFTTYAQKEIQHRNDVLTNITKAVEFVKRDSPHNAL